MVFEKHKHNDYHFDVQFCCTHTDQSHTPHVGTTSADSSGEVATSARRSLFHQPSKRQDVIKEPIEFEEQAEVVDKHTYDAVTIRTWQRDTAKVEEAIEKAITGLADEERTVAAMVKVLHRVDPNALNSVLSKVFPGHFRLVANVSNAIQVLKNTNSEVARDARHAVLGACIDQDMSASMAMKLLGVNKKAVATGRQHRAKFEDAATAALAAAALDAPKR